MRVMPAALAIAGGVFLAVLLLAPFVYRSYRRRGELGWRPVVLAFGFLVYGLALVTYTLFPIPVVDAAWCAAHTSLSHAQLDPLRFLADIVKEGAVPAHPGLLANPAVQQVVFNVALFVPLGAYLRLYLRKGVLWATVAGFAVSLLIECTQLTGNWFLFECPYRLFDVDDLLANTLGALFGTALTPLLRLFQGAPSLDSPEWARPVTTSRRLLGMLVDWISVTVLGGFLAVSVNLVLHFGFDTWTIDLPGGDLVNTVLSMWLPAVLLLAVPALTSEHGTTLGQRAVRLRRVRHDGTPPGRRVLPALLLGCSGYYLLTGLAHLSDTTSGLASLLAFGAFVLAWPKPRHPGLSGLATGLAMTDARPAQPTEPPIPTTSKGTP
ncbi:VanZ family protein [Crossiella equi]|uniref:VanZ family protein n=1 Tax=Crossiella equi TaxID=130796 RepID=UPI0027DC3A49|nr:VanZ family protein [Crossiella equi]